MIQLSAEEIRVLGSLMEKEKTTPDNYPISLNSLTLACNQKSNRDPVMDLTENKVLKAIDGLRDKKLAWECTTPGSRVPKYQHQFPQIVNVDSAEMAIVSVLMLRGPQTVGELKARCFRLYEFTDLNEVETTLKNLASKEEGGLVVRLPRQRGRKECRYMHLFGDSEERLVEAEESYGGGSLGQGSSEVDSARIEALEKTVENLSQNMESLKQRVEEFIRQFE